MNSFPGSERLLRVYEDHQEALMNLYQDRTRLVSDPRSRLYGLVISEIEKRLEDDRKELDRWFVMMLIASFEATIRTDAKNRIGTKPRDIFRKPLRALYKLNPKRVRLTDILNIWDAHIASNSTSKKEIRELLHHRHWLAHGRYWDHRQSPGPERVYEKLEEYIQAIQLIAPNFPRL